MEAVLLVIAVVVALVLLARSPFARSVGRAHDDAWRAEVGGADVNHQFRRPRHGDGGLL